MQSKPAVRIDGLSDVTAPAPMTQDLQRVARLLEHFRRMNLEKIGEGRWRGRSKLIHHSTSAGDV